jgi:hypothetical protein
MQKPSVGRIVHYISYGTPGGEYPSTCRAAIVTAVHEIANVYIVALCVLNPEGMFFNGYCGYQEHTAAAPAAGGSWHWPELVTE